MTLGRNLELESDHRELTSDQVRTQCGSAHQDSMSDWVCWLTDFI